MGSLNWPFKTVYTFRMFCNLLVIILILSISYTSMEVRGKGKKKLTEKINKIASNVKQIKEKIDTCGKCPFCVGTCYYGFCDGYCADAAEGLSAEDAITSAKIQISKNECENHCKNDDDSCETCISGILPNITSLGFVESKSCSTLCKIAAGGIGIACAPFVINPFAYVFCGLTLLPERCYPCLCSAVCHIRGDSSTSCSLCHTFVNSLCPDCIGDVRNAAIKCAESIEEPPVYAACILARSGPKCATGCVCQLICKISEFKSLCDTCQKKIMIDQ